MSRRAYQTTCPYPSLKHMLSARVLFAIASISFVTSLYWIKLVNILEEPPVDEKLIQEAIKNVEKDYRYSAVYRKTSKLPKELKYILLWTPRDFAPFYYFGQGQRKFLQNNCSVINCYVTTDRKFFGGDTTKFDAIAFNGRNMEHADLPKHRSPHQKYIFFTMESADNYPVCKKKFDGFFNWTATYRLDSDIPCPYIMAKNSNGEVIAPKIDMKWPADFPEVSKEFAEKLANKSKAAAWFVSHCSSRSGRKDLVQRLQKALEPYGHQVDVYGSCGPLKCPRTKKNACDLLLEKNYFFYLSLENSFDDDYVTEKLLTALQHDILPIVYGGANYSRFLPPGSYLDARKYSAFELASVMDRLMNAPKLYQEFFRWKEHIHFSDPSAKENVCDVCAMLNDDRRTQESVYHEFRKWWNPHFQERC